MKKVRAVGNCVVLTVFLFGGVVADCLLPTADFFLVGLG